MSANTLKTHLGTEGFIIEQERGLNELKWTKIGILLNRVGLRVNFQEFWELSCKKMA